MAIKKKVQVWVIRRKEGQIQVLLLKTNARRGGFWQPVTGSVEAGESLESAAAREADEETSLHFAGEVQPLHHSFQFENWGATWEETGFALQAKSDSEVKIDPNEHQDHRWVAIADAEALLKFDSNKEMLRRLTERLNEVII